MAERDQIQEWADTLRAMATGGQLRKALRIGATRAALLIQREAALNATTAPHPRSGALRRSIKGTVEEVRDASLSIVIRAGGGKNDLRYAAIHEYGGTVRPKNAQYLSIPMPAAKTKAGVSRYKSPRDAGPMSWIPISRGRFLLVQRTKRKSTKRRKRGSKAAPRKGVALFLLTKEPTTIRPSRYIGKAIDSTAKRLGEAMADAVMIEVDRGI